MKGAWYHRARWAKCIGLAGLLLILLMFVACTIQGYLYEQNQVRVTDKTERIFNEMEDLK